MPRSKSTILLKEIFRALKAAWPETKAYNESFRYQFYAANGSTGVESEYRLEALPAWAHSYGGVMSHIRSQTGPVIAKDIILQTGPLLENPQDAKDFACVFLVRNPHDALISYYKLLKTSPIQNKSTDRQRMAQLKELKGFYDKLIKIEGSRAIIVLTDDLDRDFEGTIDGLLRDLGVPISEKVAAAGDLEGGGWVDIKNDDSRDFWHNHALSSDKARNSSRASKKDAAGEPTFEEICLEDRGMVMGVYREILPVYEEFLGLRELQELSRWEGLGDSAIRV